MNLIVSDLEQEEVIKVGNLHDVLKSVNTEMSFLTEIKRVLEHLQSEGYQLEVQLVTSGIVSASYLTEHVTSVTLMSEFILDYEEVKRILNLKPDDVTFFIYENGVMQEI